MRLSVTTFPESLHITGRLFKSDRPETQVRDSALLLALGHRSAAMFGQEPYPGIHHKAAALLHGITNGFWNTTDIEAT